MITCQTERAVYTSFDQKRFTRVVGPVGVKFHGVQDEFFPLPLASTSGEAKERFQYGRFRHPENTLWFNERINSMRWVHNARVPRVP